MTDLCGDKQQQKSNGKSVEKVGGPLAHMAHTVPSPLVAGPSPVLTGYKA